MFCVCNETEVTIIANWQHSPSGHPFRRQKETRALAKPTSSSNTSRYLEATLAIARLECKQKGSGASNKGMTSRSHDSLCVETLNSSLTHSLEGIRRTMIIMSRFKILMAVFKES